VEPLSELADALRGAHWPSLIPVLGRLTGDPGRFAHLWPDTVDVLDAQGGMSEEQQRQAYALALEILSGEPDPPPVDDDLARALLAPLLGRDLDAYAELAAEEIGLHAPDPRAPAPLGAPLTAAVVGAGMSGLLAAHRLGQAGVDVVVLEKNPDLGGTWFENTYPGCRVDVPSHLYTYAGAPELDWADTFAAQPDILAGFRRFAHDSGVVDRIRFGTEVTAMEWDGARWIVSVRDDGPLVVDVVVNAVGQLNRPSIPDIPGRDRFRGRAFHTAAWDHSARIDGARVAVIGTGASAVQLLPDLAERAGATTVFQRTPPWLIPTPGYLGRVDPRLRWLLARVPGYQSWYRFWLLRGLSDALLPYATVDPDWPGGGATVSRANDRIRQVLLDHLEREFADRPDLLRHVVPGYPPFAKRAVRDDGAWARTLARPDVELVTTAIAEITGDGVRTADGRLHHADVLVWGTGFHASRFLHPMRVRGRDGIDLHETWAGEPSAHLGMTVPGFPNLFLLYGPNTNIVVNGSAVFFTECQVTHLLACLRLMVQRGGAPVEPSPAAHDAFRARVDALNAQRAWGAGGTRSWYRTASGRVSQNWPSTLVEYWELTRTADPRDYPG
jgi:4-hydroxyacetophenone monooxygenase